MFNTKNLIILSISVILAALISSFLPSSVSGLPAYLICAFLSGIFILSGQSFKIPSKTTGQSKKSTPGTSSDSKRESGTVKWFDSSKGYGFITRSMGEDIFVHFRSIKGNGYRSLYEGQSVEFTVTEGDKGPQAEDIHIIK